MKITKKFLLFGIIPAVAQAFICVQMFQLLASVESLAEKEAKQSLIDRKLVDAIAQFVDVVVAARVYSGFSSDSARQYLLESIARSTAIGAELRDLTKDDPGTRADIDQLMSLDATVQNQFLAFMKVTPQPTGAPIDIAGFQSGRIFVIHLKQSMKILNRETALLEDTRAKLKSNREQVKQLIWTELFLGIAVIAVTYLLFRFDFVRRFNDLLQNARDLALDKPPTKLMSGNDELMELNEALKDAAQERQRAVAQKQMLFQMVAHDLRSPLMAAIVSVDTLMRDFSEKKRQHRLESLNRSLVRVVGLTGDLLTLEQLSAGALELERRNIDLKATIDESIETVQPLASSKECTITNDSASLILPIDGDRIRQVIVNLLSNAIKFSPTQATVEVMALAEKTTVRVEILDRGPGISEKDVQQLFNPYRQADGDQKKTGFGLGLAIAKMLIELHGGTIGAQPRTGGGTVFWFTLPLPSSNTPA